jgi:hypothetical protein
LAIGIRASDAAVRTALAIHPSSFRTAILATASPLIIAEGIDIDRATCSEYERLLISAKLSEFSAGFEPHPLALAIRSLFTPDFTPDVIPRILDFENQFDAAIGDLCTKEEILARKFLYRVSYRIELWQRWAPKLTNDPYNLLKLYLLCPRDCCLHDMKKIIPLLPAFIGSDIEGALNLLFFCLGTLEDDCHISFLKVTDQILNGILPRLASPLARIRLVVCRILQLMVVMLPPGACLGHKSRIVRILRSTLDDPKRKVRRRAANARLRWMSLEETA